MSAPQKPARRRGRAKGPATEYLREQAAMLVAAGASLTRCGEELGVNRETVAAWLLEPEVAARVEALRRDALGEARKALIAAGPAAVAKLVELAAGGDRQAAIAVLDRIGLHPKQTVEHVQEDLSDRTEQELRDKATAILRRLEEAKGGLDS
jgi:hypothetical protein